MYTYTLVGCDTKARGPNAPTFLSREGAAINPPLVLLFGERSTQGKGRLLCYRFLHMVWGGSHPRNMWHGETRGTFFRTFLEETQPLLNSWLGSRSPSHSYC